MQAKNKLLVKFILEKLAEHANVKGIKGLARHIGEPESRLYGWIRNGNIFEKKVFLCRVCGFVLERA